MQRLAELSGPLVLDVVNQLEAGTVTFQVQDDRLVTLSPKLTKEAGNIDWSQSAEEIDCHVRAMQPWPKASTTLLSGETSLRCILMDVQLTKNETFARDVPPGTIKETDRHLFVATGTGILEVLKIQPQGKQAMPAAAFLNGFQLAGDARFSS